ncbi:transcriptional regulator [Halosimplex salinum]|uniref:transcriptional regulator n=1 Tax=Halosimplex salinum TaxID=1710538 RepID=UPI000F493B3B|nr:transcriptional regulator [Halosimplex salinum]
MSNTLKSISFDDMMDAVADVQRRELLVALLDHDPQRDVPVTVDRDARDAVKTLFMMKQVHLPKLVEYDFVDWEPTDYEVKKGTRFDEIKPLLELLDDYEDELPADCL